MLNKVFKVKELKMKRRYKILILGIYLVCLHFIFICADNVPNQKLINQLKKQVVHHLPKTSAVYKFQHDDMYWIKWLEINSLDMNMTTTAFLKYLEWRQVEKLDTIHLEDWSYYKNEYPAFIDSVDKIGRPLTEIWLSDWNVRKAMISGNSEQLLRWMVYLSEMGMRRLFEIRRENIETNVSGGIELIDYQDFNMIIHGCPRCVRIYDKMTVMGKLYYPAIQDEIYLINVAPSLKFLLKAWQQNQSPVSSTIMKIYGSEKEWESIVHGNINTDQLGIRFGGTRERNF